MGIADYGINGTGSADPYSTNEFVGIVSIESLGVSNSSGEQECSPGGIYGEISLQLNAVLNFGVGNAHYYYWVQNVAIFALFGSQANATVEYVDNIWNASSVAATIPANSIYGNGSLLEGESQSQYFYQDCPSSQYSGNFQNVVFSTSKPATIELQITATVNALGAPEVQFSYVSTASDKSVVYDDAAFPWARNPSFPQFIVSPTTKIPYTIIHPETEFVWAGPCCLLQTNLEYRTIMSMSLEYDATYAGVQQLEYVPNAYNWGSNTGESVTDTTITASQSPLGVSVSAPTESSLGQIYWSNWLQFYDNNSSIPQYLEWNVKITGPNLVNPIVLTAYGRNISVQVPDGKYSWQIYGVVGYTVSPASGNVTVSKMANVYFVTKKSGGGGGGCVAFGTPILTPTGYVPIQELRTGNFVEEYNLTSGHVFIGKLVSANMTKVTEIVDINRGYLFLTLTEQPIYIRNATFQGWLHDPQNLTTSDQLFNPLTKSWISVTSVSLVRENMKVYDVITTTSNDFIANGALLDKKTP